MLVQFLSSLLAAITFSTKDTSSCDVEHMLPLLYIHAGTQTFDYLLGALQALCIFSYICNRFLRLPPESLQFMVTTNRSTT